MNLTCSKHGDTLTINLSLPWMAILHCREWGCDAPIAIQETLPGPFATDVEINRWMGLA